MRHLARKTVPVVREAPAGSLAAALGAVPDGRAPFGWRRGRAPLPLVAVLQVSVAALLCGAQSLAAIAQWSRERLDDAPDLLVALGLPPGRTPSVATLHRLFKTLDVAAFERTLGQWLQETSVQPSEALAIDGKTLRGAARGTAPGMPGAHLVAAYAHEAQLIVAQVASAGKGHELAAVQQVLTHLPLAGRVVTADALATQRAVCQQVTDAKGAYLLPVKENQPALLEDCQAAFSPLAGDRAGWDGRAGGTHLVSPGTGRPGRRPAPRGAPSAQGAARTAGDTTALGARGPRSQRSLGRVRRP